MLKMLMFDFRESEKIFFKEYYQNDLDITFYKESLNENTELSEEEKEKTVILSVFINSHINKNVLDKFKNLRLITTRSTGYNHIDIEECRRRNINVINIANYGRTSVAQYTIGIIITMVRNILTASNDVKNRNINYEKYEGRDISNMTLGVIGTGAIGSAVCEIAHIMGMKILGYDIKKNKTIENIIKYTTFNNLLSSSDIITLHLPYTHHLYHMLSEKEFQIMKNNSYIINTSRGEFIDIEALYNNILNNKIKGAALDVIECEDLNINNTNTSELLKTTNCLCFKNSYITQKLMSFPNVIITPHIAYNTEESIEIILEETFKNIKKYFQGFHDNQIV